MISKIGLNGSNMSIASDNVATVRQNLEKLAEQHNTDVQTLLKSAASAGSSALPYQVRALNLSTRLKRLEGKQS